MNLSLPSLERIALLKVVSILWNKHICNCEAFYDRQSFVVANIDKLRIPQYLREKIINVSQIVETQVQSWFIRNSIYITNASFNVSIDLRWNRVGTIDERKMAESVVKCENIHTLNRYRCACTHCLESDIELLWDNLEHKRYTFVDLLRNNVCVTFWTFKMNPKLSFLSCTKEMPLPIPITLQQSAQNFLSNLFVLKESIKVQNLFLIEYIWRKFSTPERVEFLNLHLKKFDISHSLRPKRTDADIFYVLLSYLDEEQQDGVLKENAFSFLSHLVFLPFNEFLIHYAKYSYDYLSQGELLDLIDNVFVGGETGLFEEFWKKIPENRKRLVLKNGFDSQFLRNLFEVGNRRIIALVLHDANSEEKEELIFSAYGIKICKYLVVFGGRDLFKYLITVCLLSKQSVLKFKNEVLEDNSPAISGHVYSEEENKKFSVGVNEMFDF